MRTFEEMKAAAQAHNDRQDKHFLSKLVAKINAELDEEERQKRKSR